MSKLMKPLPETLVIPSALPFAFKFPSAHTALLLIDLQRDFLQIGGFGDIQSGSQLAEANSCLQPCVKLLSAFRKLGMNVIHTREGHVPDLSDCPASKLFRQASAPPPTQHHKVIGDEGPMGRLLVRGEYGHDLVDEVKPRPGELVIDKPGKGAFWATDLLDQLKSRGITHLIVGGVTTECCVSTTVREANDRGLECCVIRECTAGYNPSFKGVSLDMIHWSDGLFGFVAGLEDLLLELLKYSFCVESQNESINVNANGTNGIIEKTWDGDLSLAALSNAYLSGKTTPTTVIKDLYPKLLASDPAIWIHLLPISDILEIASNLEQEFPDPENRPPLFGIPFSIKDSIDLENTITTVACPSLSRIAETSAAVVQKFLSLGAIPVGKTNLDCLATGLTGVRSTYGTPKSVFSSVHISGGSSSGAAVSVGARLVSFAVATDTAGSGRVPAGFNGIVGWKPTKGTLSFSGVVTACESLDCIALMSREVSEVRRLWSLVRGRDGTDRMAKHYEHVTGNRPVTAIGPSVEVTAKFKFMIPPRKVLETVCCFTYLAAFDETVKRMKSIGGVLVDDSNQEEDLWSIFEDSGKLLYDGSFVAERLAGLPEGWLDDEHNVNALHPVVREIFLNVKARKSRAEDVYRDLHKMMSYRQRVRNSVFNGTESGIDILVVPTAPKHYTVEEVNANPIATNSHLGTFTHFGNVLDLCACAVPVGLISGKMPFSVTLLGGESCDAEVLAIAERVQRYAGDAIHVDNTNYGKVGC